MHHNDLNLWTEPGAQVCCRVNRLQGAPTQAVSKNYKSWGNAFQARPRSLKGCGRECCLKYTGTKVCCCAPLHLNKTRQPANKKKTFAALTNSLRSHGCVELPTGAFMAVLNCQLLQFSFLSISTCLLNKNIVASYYTFN